MHTYLPDTNVLVDLGRDPAVQTKLENAEQSGSKFVIAPSTMTELTVGVVKGGATCFEPNKKIFTWLKIHSDAILDLPRPFIGKTLGFPSKWSQVETHHHVQRVEMVANSQTFDEFLKRKDAVGNVWSDIDKAAQIHDAQVDKEFTALEKFAKLPQGTFDVAAEFCKTFAAGGGSQTRNCSGSIFRLPLNMGRHRSRRSERVPSHGRMTEAGTGTSSFCFILPTRT
ncbi:MAG: hypothetical protein ABSG62_23300 [Terracidiphilus sp.]|jgi:hypothetical protein